MFRAIAPRYDFISRVFSFGMDRRWKETAVARAQLPKDALVLDLACGTGDISQIVVARRRGTRSVAVDLTESMLHLARQRGAKEIACADACALPFAGRTFDAVFVCYGLRNFSELESGIREIARVTRPSGMMVSLDIFLPENPILRRIYLAYLYANGAFWGLVLHRRPRTYTYIPDSVRSFLSINQLTSLLRENGYAHVEEQSHIFGGIGLHWARKR